MSSSTQVPQDHHDERLRVELDLRRHLAEARDTRSRDDALRAAKAETKRAEDAARAARAELEEHKTRLQKERERHARELDRAASRSPPRPPPASAPTPPPRPDARVDAAVAALAAGPASPLFSDDAGGRGGRADGSVFLLSRRASFAFPALELEDDARSPTLHTRIRPNGPRPSEFRAAPAAARRLAASRGLFRGDGVASWWRVRGGPRPGPERPRVESFRRDRPKPVTSSAQARARSSSRFQGRWTRAAARLGLRWKRDSARSSRRCAATWRSSARARSATSGRAPTRCSA